MNDSVLLAIDGAVATVTLNNPDKHNRLRPEDLRRIPQLLDQAEASPGLRVLILTGAGERSFCSGFDIGSIPSGPGVQGEGFEEMVARVASVKVPVIAALNGGVFGGAADLALACDFRLGVEGMRLFVPPARLDLHYYPAGLRRFVEKLGPSVAKRVFLTAEELSDSELLRIGYLDWLVKRAQFKERVGELAARIAGMAPLAVAGMKQAIDAFARAHADETPMRAAILQSYASQDLREGLAAQRERRKPRFAGK